MIGPVYVIGVDVGTTGTKSILADEKGRIISSDYMAYPLITLPGGTWSRMPGIGGILRPLQ